MSGFAEKMDEFCSAKYEGISSDLPRQGLGVGDDDEVANRVDATE
jgi:hypothetical protein